MHYLRRRRFASRKHLRCCNNFLQVSIYSKTCDSHQYVYTGTTETSAICCHKGKVINCDEAKKGYDEEMC